MSSRATSESVTAALVAVPGVQRFYRAGGVATRLQSLVAGDEPSAHVDATGSAPVVVAQLGVSADSPATETLAAAAAAVLEDLRASGATQAEVTLRVCRIL